MDEYIKKADVLEYLSARRNQVLKSPLSTLDAKFEVMEIFDFVTHRVESADVAPMKHGRWEVVVGSDGKEKMVCTGCRKQQELTAVFSYCPNCGSKMDGET